jgi:hypothetical protein
LAQKSQWRGETELDCDPVDLIKGDRVTGAVIELRGARALVRRHGLSVFECATGLEIGGDPGRTKHVTAELNLETGLGCASPDQPVVVDAVH